MAQDQTKFSWSNKDWKHSQSIQAQKGSIGDNSNTGDNYYNRNNYQTAEDDLTPINYEVRMNKLMENVPFFDLMMGCNEAIEEAKDALNKLILLPVPPEWKELLEQKIDHLKKDIINAIKVSSRNEANNNNNNNDNNGNNGNNGNIVARENEMKADNNPHIAGSEDLDIIMGGMDDEAENEGNNEIRNNSRNGTTMNTNINMVSMADINNYGNNNNNNNHNNNNNM